MTGCYVCVLTADTGVSPVTQKLWKYYLSKKFFATCNSFANVREENLPENNNSLDLWTLA